MLKNVITSLKEISAKRYVMAIIAGIFALSIFIYVWIFGVNLLYLDEWSFAHLVENFYNHGWSFSLLFEQHNEHRLFFPRLFYLLTLPLSNMNSLFYMHFNAIMICMEFVLLFLVAKRQFQFKNVSIPVWLIILPLFVFNFRQWENLIWAFQIAWYIVLVASVLTFYLIEKLIKCKHTTHRYIYLSFILVFAIIATFSSAMGFLVWIAGSIQLAIHWIFAKNKAASFYLAIFAVVGTMAFRFYLKNLELPLNNNFQFAYTNPLKFLHFFFCLISLTSIKWLSVVALPIGIALFSLSLYLIFQAYKNQRIPDNSFWIAIYCFSMLFALITSIGRAPYFFEFTDRSRYTTFTLLITVSTFMLAYDFYISSHLKTHKKPIRIFFYCLILLAFELNAIGIVYGHLIKKDRLLSKEIILNYKTESLYKLKEIDPWLPDSFIEEVKHAAPFVEEHKFNVFKQNKK